MKKATTPKGDLTDLARRFARHQTEDNSSRMGLRDARRFRRAESVLKIYADDPDWKSRYMLPDIQVVLQAVRAIERKTIQKTVRQGLMPLPSAFKDIESHLTEILSHRRKGGGPKPKFGTPEQISAAVIWMLPAVHAFKKQLKTCTESEAEERISGVYENFKKLAPKGLESTVDEVDFLQAWRGRRRTDAGLASQLVALVTGLTPTMVGRYHAESLKSAKTRA